MELTQKQKEGLDIALDRYLQGEKYTIISGYAGTGKSTLVKHLIEALPGIDPEQDVIFTSFTGKATQVLAKKGNKNTSTLHRLLFKSVPRPDGTFARIPVTHIPYKVVVVDEISMAPKSLVSKLMNYKVYVIGLGDPFQLPPVEKNEDNHLLDNPHVFLDEIMRQEAESEIIQLTMKIRNGEPIPYMQGKEVQVIKMSDLNTGMLFWADQVLVATNAMRTRINNEMRQILGRGEKPEDGDKVICCRNYWDLLDDNESPLINGTIGTIKDSFMTFNKLPGFFFGDYCPKNIDILRATFVGDCGEVYGSLPMDNKMILEGAKTLDWKTEYKIANSKKYSHLLPLEFTYAYAITTHKSQGSEWDKVLVIEERFPFNKEEHARWLYTACTRASEKLVLVRP